MDYPAIIGEAATIKSRVLGIVKELDNLLSDKQLPESLRGTLTDTRAALHKRWDELKTESDMEGGHKSVASAEIIKKEGNRYVLYTADGKKKLYSARAKSSVEKRERQINYFKHKSENDKEVPMKETKQAASAAEPVTEHSAKADVGYMVSVPCGVVSFAQLNAIQEQQEVVGDVKDLTEQFQGMLSNIMWGDGIANADKVTSLQALFGEYISLVGAVLTPATGMEETSPVVETPTETPTEAPVTETPAAEASVDPVAPAEVPATDMAECEVKMTETASGSIVLEELAEAASDVLYMDVQVIRPGWGNSQDNHYYPAEMLKSHASKFIGAKMYETDHKADEKNTRTWVSSIQEIKGYTDDGSPIARVAVHDPGFAQRVRNLKAAGNLGMMECSILASGTAKPYEENGRKGKVVQSITEVDSVDWVTRAGAGGKVLSLAETATGGEGTGSEAVEPEAVQTAVEGQADAAKVEVETPAGVTVTAEADVKLTEAEVSSELDKLELPQPMKLKLSAREYATVEKLREAATQEIEYVKELTGSGQVKGLQSSTAHETSLEEVNRMKDAVNTKWLRNNKSI